MDSGLGVRWPLSPYATALAAGALFAFCIAVWRYRPGIRRGPGKDPGGLNPGKDLECKKEQNDCQTCDKKKNEKETEKTNFPVLAFRDLKSRCSYESLCLSGRFGAIPRTTQRTSENSHLYSILRRRNVGKENTNWQDLSPVSPNFSCIYQQSFCLGNEVPKLDARFVLNISPYLNSYLKQFCQLRDFQASGISRRGDFEQFDVSINSNILKDKPITRSAVCLALERQLHKYLSNEPVHELQLSEKAIQTANISEKDDETCDTPTKDNVNKQNSNSSNNTTIQERGADSDEYSRSIVNNASLWDSGYCDKTMDERCGTPKEKYSDTSTDLIVACASSPAVESNDNSRLNSEYRPSSLYSANSENMTQISFSVNQCPELAYENGDKLYHSVDATDDFNSTESRNFVNEQVDKSNCLEDVSNSLKFVEIRKLDNGDIKLDTLDGTDSNESTLTVNGHSAKLNFSQNISDGIDLCENRIPVNKQFDKLNYSMNISDDVDPSEKKTQVNEQFEKLNYSENISDDIDPGENRTQVNEQFDNFYYSENIFDDVDPGENRAQVNEQFDKLNYSENISDDVDPGENRTQVNEQFDKLNYSENISDDVDPGENRTQVNEQFGKLNYSENISDDVDPGANRAQVNEQFDKLNYSENISDDVDPGENRTQVNEQFDKLNYSENISDDVDPGENKTQVNEQFDTLNYSENISDDVDPGENRTPVNEHSDKLNYFQDISDDVDSGDNKILVNKHCYKFCNSEDISKDFYCKENIIIPQEHIDNLHHYKHISDDEVNKVTGDEYVNTLKRSMDITGNYGCSDNKFVSQDHVDNLNLSVSQSNDLDNLGENKIPIENNVHKRKQTENNLDNFSNESHIDKQTENLAPILDFSSSYKFHRSKILDELENEAGSKETILLTNELNCQNPEYSRQEIKMSSKEENITLDFKLEINRDFRTNPVANIGISENEVSLKDLPMSFKNSDLELFQETSSSLKVEEPKSGDENLFLDSENVSVKEKNLDYATRAFGVDAGETDDKSITLSTTMNLANSDLEGIQKAFDSGEEQNDIPLSQVLETERSESSNSRVTETSALERDVIHDGSSRDSSVFDERGTSNVPRQMDRETGERSVAVESTVTTETSLRTNGDARLSTAVVSRLTLDSWSEGGFDKEDSVSVRTTVSEEVYRPTFEEFVPLKSCEKNSKRNTSKDDSLEEILPFEIRSESETKILESSDDELLSSPRVDRLKGLMSRDEKRRSRTKFHHLADGSHVGGAMEGEWDRLLRDVLASVSELERWERRQCDVSTDAEDAEQQHHFSQSDSSFTMEEEALSPNKGETPTKIKNLRFKLDPDVFDVPSDDSFYDDDDDEVRRGWKKQSKYRAFSSLELNDEPVKLVSVHASVVPAGQKMVARPIGIDLHVRLTEERHSKRAHVSTSPSQAKRRSPVSDRGVGWCQELSPVTENVDWRETFTPVTSECKSVPNGILKTPSPKLDPPPVESPNPFKLENGVTTNGVSPLTENRRIDKPKYNGVPWRAVERKPFLLPRKKFEPDPEAIERITGYKSALSKPPLPPPVFLKINASINARHRAELARKQYLDSKAALAVSKVDSSQKFQQFLNQAQSDRARIVTSVPDLAAIERAVTEQWIKERASVSPRESPGREDSVKTDDVTLSRGSTPDDKWASYVQSCRQHLGRRSQSMTYLETDIDIIPVLDEDDKCHSTSALDEPDEALPDPDDSDLDRSREDLDDSGRAKSEHELRIERSLRSLPIPDWYRRSEKTKTGFLLGSSVKEKRGWAAAKSLASSTSSLASCGLRRPVRSLRSSRENIPWSRSSASPDGPALSLALAKAFREPYLGWRARTPTSSGVSSSPRASPPSWGATTTDDEANGVSFDGEDAFGRTTSSEEDKRDEPLSLDDTGADAVTVSMDTNDPVKLPGGEDTCDDINNMSMDTCELFDASVVVPVDEDPSPQADTGDDIDNLSTDTTTPEGRKLDPKLKRYSYSQSIYHSEWEEEEESRGDKKSKGEERESTPSSPDHKVVWIESSFVGSRTTTSIMVIPEKKVPGNTHERPASR